MSIDIRLEAARYYDYSPSFPRDIPFYIARLPSPEATILELGCGTGRVTLPLSQHCQRIQGIDLSEAMIAICREKIAKAGIPASRIGVKVGDITHLELEGTFDLILAPFRVFQNLETDEEVEGFFEGVREHLAPGGNCILNVFRPYADRETLIREWCTESEKLAWEVEAEGGKVACFDRRPRMDPEKLVLYPELIYRKYVGEALVDEAVLKIAMRCYYPEEFEALITRHGFDIQNRWGGYEGEVYGEGPEQVIEFGARSIR